MTSTIRIYRHDDPTFNEDTGVNSANQGRLIYQGIARIWMSDSGQILELGEQDINFNNVNISIPVTEIPAPHRDDLAVIDTCPDYDMAGRAFRIMSVDGGGLSTATRRMSATGWGENHSWWGLTQ